MIKLEDVLDDFLSMRVSEIYANLHEEVNCEECEEMDSILMSLPDAKRKWLDNYLSKQFEKNEERFKAFYIASLKDALHLYHLFKGI